MSVDDTGLGTDRFEFGKNWARFLEELNGERIERAAESLRSMLGELQGKRFLDIGSGSGLFSLAARQLDATVMSFDYDPQSVACAVELKNRFRPGDPLWSIQQGSILDQQLVRSLGTFDIVYAWGVLHHTGALWDALPKALSLVADNGLLFVAIYNDQGRPSRRWLRIKKTYNRLPRSLRFVIVVPAFLRLWVPTLVRDFLHGRLLGTWRSYATVRGMSPWRDVVDWVGGYPFEVAKPEEVFEFCRSRGFELLKLRTCAGGIGCNEFVFRKTHRTA